MLDETVHPTHNHPFDAFWDSPGEDGFMVGWTMVTSPIRPALLISPSWYLDSNKAKFCAWRLSVCWHCSISRPSCGKVFLVSRA